MDFEELRELAVKLALCLADEVTFLQNEAAERSLVTLAIARDKLGLQDTVDGLGYLVREQNG